MVSINLPWDLVEEILCKVNPHSLVRFRTVCKQWNSLFGDKKFVEKHLVQSRPQFIFKIRSNFYSIAIDFNSPRIDVHKLALYTPDEELISHAGLWTQKKLANLFNPHWFMGYVDCDGLLFCKNQEFNGLLIWNPWLRQRRILRFENTFGNLYFMGYDNNKRYKLYYDLNSPRYMPRYDINLNTPDQIIDIGLVRMKAKDVGTPDNTIWSGIKSNVISLSGMLCWAVQVDFNNDDIFIRSFSFSTERLTTFGCVPFEYNSEDFLALAVFKKDRLSLLNLCNITSNITIWLTKNNIDIRDVESEEEDLVWTRLMTVLIPNLPKFSEYFRLTYFLDNEDAKRLAICCYDKREDCAYIYIVKGDTCQKINIDHYSYTTLDSCWDIQPYIPSLVSPSQINENNKT